MINEENMVLGVNRTNKEKRDAVELLLSDPEWSAWSNAEIARQCNVSPAFVASIRGDKKQETVNE